MDFLRALVFQLTSIGLTFGRMEEPGDFFKVLGEDIALDIFKRLDDPADLVCAGAVSRSFRHFVLSNGIYQIKCLAKAPELHNISSVIIEELESRTEILHDPRESIYSVGSEVKELKQIQQMYASLLRLLSIAEISPPKGCIECVIASSSTERKNAVHVLLPHSKYEWGDSYWSSNGQSDPDAPGESILLQLCSSLCVVTEIQIHPYQDIDDPDSPVYAPTFVRFKMGHAKRREGALQFNCLYKNELDEDNYVWTYTSHLLVSHQKNKLQSFKLKKPALCLGGRLKIELLGRAQQNPDSGLYYIRINHVKVLGQNLSPAFDINVRPTGDLSLAFCPEAVASVEEDMSQPCSDDVESGIDPLSTQAIQIESLLWLMGFDVSADDEFDLAHYLSAYISEYQILREIVM